MKESILLGMIEVHCNCPQIPEGHDDLHIKENDNGSVWVESYQSSDGFGVCELFINGGEILPPEDDYRLDLPVSAAVLDFFLSEPPFIPSFFKGITVCFVRTKYSDSRKKSFVRCLRWDEKNRWWTSDLIEFVA